MKEQIERRKQPRRDVPTAYEVKACFHRLWSANVGQPNYLKSDWKELQKMLFRRGIEV